MKKLIIIITLLIFSTSNAYSFWIWSPKTNQWKNPKDAKFSHPTSQLDKGKDFMDKQKYKHAIKVFKRLIKVYPDSKDASDAQYLMAVCYDKIGEKFRSFLEYQKLIKTYPNSKNIQEAVKNQYEIGKFFLKWEGTKFLGIKLSLLEDHPAVEIFTKIKDTSPASVYASKSLYLLGSFLLENKRFDEAKKIFQELIDNYPESEDIDHAHYKLALSSAKSSLETDYDQTETKKAQEEIKDFLLRVPTGDSSEKAEDLLGNLREKEAMKAIETAEFYETIEKFSSALIYYRSITEKYPETKAAQIAKERMRKLNKENN